MSQSPDRSFIEVKDEFSAKLNEQANGLFLRLTGLDVQKTGIDDWGKQYFSAHHTGRRLFFSLESSARIIYDSVGHSNRKAEELVFMDYGAGLGTLFLLAGLSGFRSVLYNDLFPNWTENARILCRELDIPVTDFITGDVDAVTGYCSAQQVHIDILASRNVIEHIYSLRSFYAKLKNAGCASLIFSTTTANFHNPAMRLKHIFHHRKMEKKYYLNQREKKIRQLVPGMGAKELPGFIQLTRGRAFEDFDQAVRASLEGRPVEPVEFLYSNTCDCENGVWAEHIITRSDYAAILEDAGFKMEYTPGFWDTHYRYTLLNRFTDFLNRVIKKAGNKGIVLSPFVNVVATVPGHE